MRKKSVVLTLAIAMGLFFIISGSANAFTAQRIVIPYTVVGNSWWAGLALHNKSDSMATYNVAIYDENGNFIDGKCHDVDAHAIKADLLQNFVDNSAAVSSRVSIYIRTVGASDTAFCATLFMGNLATSMGFGLQAFESQDYETNVTILCIVPEL